MFPSASADGTSWVVVNIHRREDGWLDVTYSLAPGVHYLATINPGSDAARAVTTTGDHLSRQYNEKGYV